MEETPNNNVVSIDVIKEGKVILAPGISTDKVFYNPVQEFNRDLSCLVLSVFFEKYKLKLEERLRKKAQANDNAEAAQNQKLFEGFTIFEAMAASGIRACRYALEVPHVRKVIANDLDASACEAIRKNADYNSCTEKMEITNCDARAVMFETGFSNPQKFFHAVDLDPFGSAAPFVEGAIHCISDGGLLLVTCTDTSILCGNFPEACYARYGATAVRNPAHHEMSLRIVLHCVASRAMQHEKYIEPLLSVREGHYVRLFIVVHRGAKEAKENVRKTAYIYNCPVCHSFFFQPICEAFKTAYVNASIGSSNKCGICNTTMRIGGPIWTGPIHNPEFVDDLIAHLERDMIRFGTAKHLQGKLGMIQEELPDQPLYIVAKEMFKVLHCEPIPRKNLLSAILHSGYRFSLSHCEAEAVKTDAPFEVIWDIIKSWVVTHPISPARLSEPKVQQILSLSPTTTPDFSLHLDADFSSRKKKLLRFPNLKVSGPMAKPRLRYGGNPSATDPEPDMKKIKIS